MNKHILSFIVLLLAACYGCDRKEKPSNGNPISHTPDSTAVLLNNKAARLMADFSAYNSDSLNDLLYDSALVYLNQAIKADSLYFIAYENKAKVLRKKGLLDRSLNVLNRMQSLHPDDAGVYMEQGFLLEKMGYPDQAENKYSSALKIFERQLSYEPESLKVKLDIVFLYLFLEDRDKAQEELNKLISQHPNNEQLKSFESKIRNFNRQTFITEY